MSTSIDNRVVEMKFDNQNFEKNVKTSQETLKKFKDALDLTSSAENFNKNINSALNNINFDSMSKSLEFLENRFSTLGIVGMTVLQNLTNSAISAAKSMVNYMTNAVIQGGRTRAQNIENAKFQLAGFDIMWEKIEKDINYGVTDTAYGLDSAAMAAAQLVASGVQFGETFGETGNSPMAKALRGISGLASMTNSSYEDMSRIFTTVAGNGRLMGDQLLQVSSRGVNAAAKLAEAFNGVSGIGENAQQYIDGISDDTQRKIKQLTGGLEITETQIRDFVSKGKIDFAMFSESMDAAFGKHAKDANDTFQGVLSNVRAALAKIGADFWAPILVNKGSLVQMLNSFKARINDVKAAIRESLGWAADEGGTEYLTRWKNLVDNVFLSIKKRLDEVDIQKLTQNVKNIIESIVNFGKGIINIFNAIKILASPIVEAFKKIFNVEGVGTFLSIIEKVSVKFRDFTAILRPILLVKGIGGDILKIAQAVFSVASLGLNVLKGIASIAKTVVSAIIPAGGGAIKLASGLSSIVLRITEFIKKSEIIETAFSNINRVLKAVIDGVKGFITSFIGGFSKVAFHTDNAKEAFSKFGEKVTNVGNTIKEFLSKHLPNLTSGLSNIGGILGKVGGFVGGLFGKLKDFVKTIAPGITFVIEKLAYLIDRLAGSVVKIFNNLDTDKIFSIINKGIFAKILSQMAGFISSMSTQMGAVHAVLNRLTFFIQESFGANGTKAAMIKNFAIAIGILAASLFVLSSIDPDKLVAPLAALSAIMWEFVAVVNALVTTTPNAITLKGSIKNLFDSLAGGITLGKRSTAFVKLAASIFILAGALRILAELSPEQLATGVAGISILMFELTLVAENLSRNEQTMIKGAGALLPFSIAIVILGKAVSNLSKLSWEGLIKGLSGVVVLIATVTQMAKLMEKSEAPLMKMGLTMIPFAAGMVIFAKAVKVLSDISWEGLAKGLGSVIVLLGSIVGFTKLMKQKDMNRFVELSQSLLMFSAALVVFGAALKIISSLSWEELARGLVAVVALLGSIVGFTKLMKLKDMNRFVAMSKNIVIFSAGILVLAAALKVLSTISLEQMAISLTALAATLLGIGVFAKSMGGLEKSLASIGAGLVVFGLALALLVPELKALGNMSWAGIAKAMVALAGAFTVIGLAGLLLKPLATTLILLGASVAAIGIGMLAAGAGLVLFATGITTLGVALGTFGKGIATFIKELAGLIPEIIKIFGSAVETFAKLIASLVPAFVNIIATWITAVCDGILKAAPKIFATIIQLLDELITFVPQLVDKVTVLIIKILEALAERTPQLVKATAKFIKAFIDSVMDLFKDVSLAEFVAAIRDMSVATLILAVIGKTGALALKGLAIMALVIAGLGLIVVGLGALVNAIPELEELLTKGIPILGKIGYAIGDFVGNLVGGLMAGLSNGLPQIADNLSLFMTKLQPFIDGARQVDQGVAKSALYLAETILVLTGTSLLEGIASFITGKADFGKLGEQLVPFGEAMGKFADSVKGIDTDVVESAANAGKAIAQMAKALPNEGGFLAKLVGDNNMGLIGPQLEGFGQALKAFSDSVTANGGIDSDAVTSAANAGKAIAQMAKALPNEGGFLSKLVGDNNMDLIGPQLAKFGGSLKEFADAIAGMDTEAATNAATAGKAIAEMADALPNEGGWVDKFTGSNDMDLVGPKLEAFGKHIKAYSDNVDGFKIGPVIRSVTGGKAIAELADSLPNSDGAISWFAGNNDIDTFGEKMATFGTHLVAYSNAVADLNTTHLQDSVLAGQALADIAETVDGVNFTGLATFSTFGGNLEDFGKAISGYANSVKDMTVGWNLYWSVQTAQALADVAQTLQGSNATNVFSSSNNFKDFGTQLTVFGEALVNYSNSVANADYTSIAISSIELSKLIDMLNKIQGFDFTLASNFKMALETIASTGIKGFTNVFANATEDVKTASADVKDAVLDGFGNVDHQIYKKGEDASRSFKNGFDNIDPSVSVKALVDAVVEIFNIEKETAQQASNAITAFLLKFEENRNRAENVCKLFAERTIEGIKQADFYKAGEDSVLGYIGGLSSKNSRVYLAGYELGRLSIVAAREAVDSQSPSREFIKLGENDGEGLAIGMDNSSNLVESSAEKMSKTALQAVAKSISRMREIIDDDLEIQPVITPVLDSSQIQNGISSINGMTTGSAFVNTTGLNIARGLSYSPVNGVSSPYNDSNIVAAINGLESRLDNVASRIESMRVVLDNGTLVGEMAPGMDVELGNISTLTRRGVM